MTPSSSPTASPSGPTSAEVLGRTVGLPVQVRTAEAFTAMYAVPLEQTQRMIAASGLRALPVLPGRAMVGLVFVKYVDNDLGPYDELGVAVLVGDHDAGLPANPRPRDAWRALRSGAAGVLIHELPVDGEFTCAAGRQIWGFPKQVGDFTTDLAGPHKSTRLVLDGQLVCEFGVRRGLPLPAPGLGLALTAYSHLDGITRATTWEMNPHGVRSRPGGARLRLGSHPIARDLARLGLPKRPLFSTTIENLAMTFGAANEVATSQG